MSIVMGPKLSRLVRGLGNAIIARYEGKWANAQWIKDLDAELGKYDLNALDFRAEIARAFVRTDLARRANIDPFYVDSDGKLQPSLFDRKRFRRGIIRLGNGLSVKMIDATSQEWLVRQFNQQKAASASQLHATRTVEFLQTAPGTLLMENPRMSIKEAQIELSLWSPNDCEDDQDDEDDDEDEES